MLKAELPESGYTRKGYEEEVTDNLADRLIGNARGQRPEVVPLRSRRRL